LIPFLHNLLHFRCQQIIVGLATANLIETSMAQILLQDLLLVATTILFGLWLFAFGAIWAG
jgi:hypothetical protein